MSTLWPQISSGNLAIGIVGGAGVGSGNSCAATNAWFILRTHGENEPGTDAEWAALEKETFTLEEFRSIGAHLRSTGKASA